MPEVAQMRMEAARVKVDQILQTGAKVVANGCLSCQSTLEELKKHYDLDAEVVSVVQLASRALVQ